MTEDKRRIARVLCECLGGLQSLLPCQIMVENLEGKLYRSLEELPQPTGKLLVCYLHPEGKIISYFGRNLCLMSCPNLTSILDWMRIPGHETQGEKLAEEVDRALGYATSWKIRYSKKFIYALRLVKHEYLDHRNITAQAILDLLAREFTDRYPSRHLQTWIALLTEYAQDGREDELEQFFGKLGRGDDELNREFIRIVEDMDIRILDCCWS